MTEHDGDAFTELMMLAGEVCDVTVSPARSVMYFNILQRFELDVIRQAVNIYFGTGSKFRRFPQPNELIEIIEGSEEDAESIAWTRLHEAMRKVGGHTSVIFEDAAIGEAVLVVFGSWANFGAMSDIGVNAKRRDFVAAFRQSRAVTRANGGTRPPRLLLGNADLCNQLGRAAWMAQGWELPTRALFGLIRLDGSIEVRYLDIDHQTGMPSDRLESVLALQPEEPLARMLERAALPAPEVAEQELSATSASAALTEAFQRIVGSKMMPEDKPAGTMTELERAKRMKLLKRQQRELRKADGNRDTVSAPQDEGGRCSDGTSDESGKTAGLGDGVLLRDGTET